MPVDAAQGHDRVGVAVVPETQHAVVVRRRAARRNEDEIALRIGGERRPRVGAAALVRQLAAPVAVRRIGRVLRNRIPRPAQLPVRASKPRTSPLAVSGRLLSPIDEPVTTTPLTTTGGDVIEYACRSNGGMRSPAFRSTDPVIAESRQSVAVACIHGDEL